MTTLSDGRRLGHLAVFVLSIAIVAPGMAADPEHQSIESVGRQRPQTDGERIERAISRLKPGMDLKEAAKALELRRYFPGIGGGGLWSFVWFYNVGANQTLIIHTERTNNGGSELTAAEFRRGERTVAKFPPSK